MIASRVAAACVRGRRAAVPATALALAAAVTASASGGPHYRIRPGDTLSAIAARYHTTVAALVALNHLPGNGDRIYAGDVLRLPGAATGRSGSRLATERYTVRPGDSLYAIAARFHADARTIARVNHLPSSLTVVIGQRLAIPHRVNVTRTAGPRLLPGPVASREQVAAMIRTTAARWGVDPRFALAISYEEAGFNQAMVSRVGAIGAMQILPGTARWLSAYVVHRPLDVRVAGDNVTAGVAFLSVLLRETNGDAGKAAAGYYQGLASVRSRGMFRDTKQYVANVLALRNRF
jgi:LysM repeat protein